MSCVLRVYLHAFLNPSGDHMAATR